MEVQRYNGAIRKMRTQLSEKVEYWLPIGEDEVKISDLVGENVHFQFLGEIYCIGCGRKTNKSFAQGFCFPCFRNSPHNSECIIRPELCRGHLGEGRDPEWEEQNHNQPHVVYLAVSSSLKVGVTRSTQLPTRWIDQGAWKAMKIAETNNRYEAGVIEVLLKQYISDKTPWQKMLKNELAEHLDLSSERSNIIDNFLKEHSDKICTENEICTIDYPVLEYPKKVKSHNLDKNPEFQGKLIGIKGQYLLLDDGSVINVRKYAGYVMELEFLV